MDTNQPILDIIHINKIIVENELHKILPRTKEMQKGYNDLVKPALIKFKEKYGKSERTYIKELLENSDYKVISNLKIKTFGNWGRKINPYIWASIYIENEKNSASNSIQLYVLIDDTGMKFGFDYGDGVNENDEIVILDKISMELIWFDLQLNKTLSLKLPGSSYGAMKFEKASFYQIGKMYEVQL